MGASLEVAQWRPVSDEVAEHINTVLALQGFPESLIDIAPMGLTYGAEFAKAALTVERLFVGILSAEDDAGTFEGLMLFGIGGDEAGSSYGIGFAMVGRSAKELAQALRFLTESTNERLRAVGLPLAVPELPTA